MEEVTDSITQALGYPPTWLVSVLDEHEGQPEPDTVESDDEHPYQLGFL